MKQPAPREITSQNIQTAAVATSPNARTGSLANNIGKIVVTYLGKIGEPKKDYRKHSFELPPGFTGTWTGSELKIQEVPPTVDSKYAYTTYKPLFSKADPNIFKGFYNFDYDKSNGCTKSAIMVSCDSPTPTNEVKFETCIEGYLPEYLFNADKTPLILAFLENYKTKSAEPSYNIVYDLIKKLEPLGLVKVDNEQGKEFAQLTIQELLKSLQAVDDALNNNLTKLNALINSGDRCTMMKALWGINRTTTSNAVYESITLANRKAALKKLAEGQLTGSNIDTFWCLVGLNGGEESVIKLLLTTPAEERKPLLDYVYSEQIAYGTTSNRLNTVLSSLATRIEDGNEDTFLAIITDWVYNYYAPSNFGTFDLIINHIKPQRTFFYLNPKVHVYENCYLFGDNGKTLIHFEVKLNAGENPKRDNIDSKDYVLVQFADNFTFGTDEYQAGVTYEIPALLCYHMMKIIDEKRDAVIRSVTINGLFVAFGVAEIRGATAILDIDVAYGLIDMGLGVSGIIMDTGLADDLNKTADGQRYLDIYNKFVLIYGGARIVSDISGLTKQLRTEAAVINEARTTTLTDQLTLKFINKWYPEVGDAIKDFDLATRTRFFDDFLNLPNAEVVLGRLEFEVELINIWRISGKTVVTDLSILKSQLQQIGYTNFKTVDFLKYADGTYYGNKLVYADPAVTAESIIRGSTNIDPEAELKMFEAVCNINGTKGYTPVSTNQIAVDGVLALDNKFVQIKSNTFSNMTTRLNSTYTSANGAGYEGVHVYMEITDTNSNVNSVLNKWKNTAPYSTNKIINDGTISAITVKTNTGWVDLDLTLIR